MSVTEQDVRAAAPANAPEDVVKWVAEIAELTTPDAVEFCDGSQEEWDRLTSQMVEFFKPDLKVTLVAKDKTTVEMTVGELLPYSFTDLQ